MSLNVLNHLGINLYSNIPTVVSEAVANSYDADAETVTITIEDGRILIEDDGHGMTLEDINKRFLHVGYRKRNDGQNITPKHRRPVMGRKGIGKLSLFSIANRVNVFSVKNGEKNGLSMYVPDIQDQIRRNEGVYNPEDISATSFELEKGTRIELTELKNNVTKASSHFLKRRLARRFSVFGTQQSFQIVVNEEPITIEDRDYFKKLQFVWKVGDYDQVNFSDFGQVKKVHNKAGVVNVNSKDGLKEYTISGWIGTVEVPGQLEEKDGSGNVSNNKISLVVRGKLAQEDVLSNFKEARIFADYLIGELRADFLDLDDLEDISTSNRQQFFEFDPRYQALIGYVGGILSEIGRVWSDDRKSVAKESAFKEQPELKEWFDTLKGDDKDAAQSLFSTIVNIRLDGDDAVEKKRGLYAQGILAFERLKLRRKMSRLDLINSQETLELASVFADVDDLEAVLFHDITTERIKIIEKLSELSDAHAKERVLQQHVFDHLWLLDPSWERPTENKRMEETIKKAFDQVDADLTDEEKKGRIDIKYRETTGRDVIIELKKYERLVSVNDLTQQLGLYESAADKCLRAAGKTKPQIRLIAILGRPPKHSNPDRIDTILDAAGIQVLYYDELISNSLNSYRRYVDEQKKATRIRELIDKLLNVSSVVGLPLGNSSVDESVTQLSVNDTDGSDTMLGLL